MGRAISQFLDIPVRRTISRRGNTAKLLEILITYIIIAYLMSDR